MSHTKVHGKKTEKEIEQMLRNAKLIQDAIYYRKTEKGAFHEMDLDDWYWAEKAAEQNIFEWDVELETETFDTHKGD